MECKTPYCLNNISIKGRSPYCSKCRARKWRVKHRVKALYYAIKYNAKRRGIPFSITMDEWIIFCAETNYHNLVGNGPNDMTIDRIRTSEGYSYDNIQLMTRSENTKKRLLEHKAYIKNYPQTLKGSPDVPF